MKKALTILNKNRAVIFSLLAIICIIIFCFAISPVSLQNDTFYTIKIGEHILQEGKIDMIDPFSWHENLPYTYPHWAYDVFIYLIYSAFGMTGIYLSTCILASILGISIYLVNCKLAKNQLISFLITIGALYLLQGYIAARAQLVTFILFILTIYFIEKFLETKKKRYAVSLIIIPIIIANVHSAVWPFYFVLFLPYIAEYILTILADTFFYKKIQISILKRKIKKAQASQKNLDKIQEWTQKLNNTENKAKIIKEKRENEKPYKIYMHKNDATKWLIIIAIIAILTGFLTPLGTTPYTYLYNTLQGTTPQNISEHLPMILGQNTPILIVIAILIAVLTFTKIKIRLRDLFMIAGLTYLMIISRRQQSMFVLIGAVILNKLIYSLCEEYDKGGIKQVYNFMLTKLGIFLTIAVILILSMYFYKPKIHEPYITEEKYPVKACDYIVNNLDLGKVKFYNEYNYGSYLIFRDIPVFIDSRADLYAPEFNTQTGNSKDGKDIFTDFINISSINTYYGDMFEKYGITHIITPKKSKLNMLITKTEDKKYYKNLYEDDNFVIYEILKN